MMNTSDENFVKWLIMAPLGLLLLGSGLSMVGEAIIRKRDGKPWFAFGTVALIVFNAGVSIFGDAVKHRVLLEQSNE
jgi:hypothetical protein